MLQKIWKILKLLSLKLMRDSKLVSIRILFVKVTLKIGQGKYVLLILQWQLILEVIKLKKYAKEKQKEDFMKKDFCWVNLNKLLSRTRQSFRDKVKIILDLSNYTTKTKLDHATGLDTSDLAVKNKFIALKSKADKLHITKLVNI